jgi:hypothetical protein
MFTLNRDTINPNKMQLREPRPILFPFLKEQPDTAETLPNVEGAGG